MSATHSTEAPVAAPVDNERHAPTTAPEETAAAAPAEKPVSESDNDDGDDEDEDKPYGKKQVKKMMKNMNKPIEPDWDAGREVDEEGFKAITWGELDTVFSYERVAEGYKLYGDISQKNKEHWERAKQIKVRDKDGREGAIFFYDDESKPYFEWEDVQVGNEIVIKNPRLHRFLDGQDGMRIESNKAVARVAKRRFTDIQRLDYGKLNKDNGNKKYAKKKYDDAIECYETAINHLQGTFHQNPELEQEARELAASCYLNIAAAQIGQERFRVVEIACRSALKINASAALNAKAYFRIGQAALKEHEYQNAREALVKANDLAPGDAAIVREINALNEAMQAHHEAQKELYDLHKRQKEAKFGLKKSLLSTVPTTIDGVLNFRDVSRGVRLTRTVAGTEGATYQATLKRHTLYRSANYSAIAPSGLRAMVNDLGIKTVLDLRTKDEVSVSKKQQLAKVKKFNKTHEIDILMHKKTEGDKGLPAMEFADLEQQFAPIYMACKPNTSTVSYKVAKSPAVKGRSAEALIADDRVVLHLDLSTRVVMALASWWTLITAFFLGLLAFFYAPMMRHAARVMIRGTALRVGIEAFYIKVLEQCGAEIAAAMRVAANPTNYPILVCCSMGKDRTGIVVALLLAVAGARDEDIVADYVLSTSNQSDEQRVAVKQLGLSADWNEAKAATMHGVLQYLRSKHGSVEGYLKHVGVTEEEIEGIRNAVVAAATARS